MQISEFTFRIILIFIPGLITFIIVDNLTVHKEIKLHRMLFNSLIFGFICYFTYYLMAIIPCFNLKFSFIEKLTDNSVTLDFKEILIATGLSLPIGFFFSFLINYKVLHRFAHRLRISNKFGDIDVWSYIMNSKMPEWVVIRDVDNDLMYEGWIRAFSDGTEENELFLRDVKVYKNSTGEELYKIPGLYLARKRENLIVEFPLLEYSEYKDSSNRKEGKIE